MPSDVYRNKSEVVTVLLIRLSEEVVVVRNEGVKKDRRASACEV